MMTHGVRLFFFFGRVHVVLWGSVPQGLGHRRDVKWKNEALAHDSSLSLCFELFFVCLVNPLLMLLMPLTAVYEVRRIGWPWAYSRGVSKGQTDGILRLVIHCRKELDLALHSFLCSFRWTKPSPSLPLVFLSLQIFLPDGPFDRYDCPWEQKWDERAANLMCCVVL